ncbi:hypothetical protein H6F71_05145 [Microcoleus sp. FACHB-61]|nr:hypothetical protein [Microcoleus sp. FACHB-61]
MYKFLTGISNSQYGRSTTKNFYGGTAILAVPKFQKGGIPHNNYPRNMWNGHLGCSEKVAGKPAAKYAG